MSVDDDEGKAGYGKPIGSTPRKLSEGDVVLVGDVELVYEEKKP